MSVCLSVCLQVENDRCSVTSSSVRRNFLVNSGPAEWRRVSVKLKAGVNVLAWQVYALSSSRGDATTAGAMTTAAAVKIRLIEIRGQ